MQLPIYVVDEKRHIDEEYEDIEDLTRVLDPIFPSNDIDAELEFYLTIADAERLYQPIGDYALKSEIPDVSDFITDEDLVEALEDYYTKDEADARFQPIGDYVDEDTFSAYTADTSAVIDELDNRKADLSALTPYFDDAEYDTIRKEIVFYNNGVEKDSIDARPFIKDGMVSDVKIVGDNLVITFNTDSGKEPISIPLSSIFNPSNYYTKDESDDRFQPKGDYVDESDYDVFTATTIAEIENLNNNKLDVTAYTPTDLSNYYTKQEIYNKNETYSRNEIDDKIVEAGGFDPTQYYTKTVSDNRFAFKSDIPSLDGYATEDWVLSKKYATVSSVQQYISNLQQQINSIVEAVSGCCQTVETIYRWLTLTDPNDYLCSGTTKYEKQIYQESTDGGMTWTNVQPIEYRRGAVLETDSLDCGYVPDPQYRWKAAPASDYMCSGTSKYYKEYYEVSNDEGVTWEHVVPEQTRRGSLIEANSTDCGYIAPQYRWYTSQSEYICSGTTKYEKQYYQVSTDGGTTWENVSPLQTRTGSVIEYNSEDCGYVPPTPQYRWKDTSSKTCSGYNKYYVAVKQVSNDEGKTWENVTPIETQLGSLYQAYSYSCGYVGTPKLKIYTDNGDMNQLNCESSTSNTLTCAEYWDVYDNFNGDACSGLHIEIEDCVTQIGDLLYGRTISFGPCAKTIDYGKNVTRVLAGNGSAENCSGLTAVTLPPNITDLNVTFRNCTSLKNMIIPSKVTRISTGIWQNCSSLESLTFLSVTPPDLGEYYANTFQNTNNCILYVPSQSLNAYKTANGWKEYASRIMPINS